METSRKKSRISALRTSADPRWARVAGRDRSADGSFYYSVSTTGIYCRPSCPAKLAHPENVRFHSTWEEAEKAGFRPCRRCRPRDFPEPDRNALIVTQACRIIEESDKHLPLRDLAQRTGLSEHHFHRVFKKLTGLTPKSYATACRNQKLKNELNHAASVTEAIYNAGYASNSRFYDTSSHAIGMTATAYRQGGVNMEIRFAVGECMLGAILVAQSERGICAILLGNDAEELVRDLQNRFPKATLVGGDSAFEHTIAKVVGIIQTPGMNLDMPLDINGTAFQQRVWQALRKIPFGKTVSYAELARLVGAPKAVRAVASACAANAHAIAIPCHRVVRTDGSLSGYRWGIERKRSLIDMELQGKIGQDKK